ncbi:hypothetical protein ACFU7Y_25000 [Kitasatospora sp. NPDC057542]|uniref:hypothetical protein n=1 Tax=Kitasatospora sp. NPDC057542 TaxID=3346162 RepID=UPI0036A8AD61
MSAARDAGASKADWAAVLAAGLDVEFTGITGATSASTDAISPPDPVFTGAASGGPRQRVAAHASPNCSAGRHWVAVTPERHPDAS